MKVVLTDGGRSKYFKASKVGDCVTRAVAIATKRDYKEVYNEIAKVIGYTPRNGVRHGDAKKVMKHFGAYWLPFMKIGSGCKVHLKDDEVPSKGTYVCKLSGHVCALVDGVVYDSFDPTRDSSRCVYGVWGFPNM